MSDLTGAFLSCADIPASGFGVIRVDCRVRGCISVVHLDLAKVVADTNWYPRSPNVRSYDHDLPFNGAADRLRSLMQLVRAEGRLPPVAVYVPGEQEFVCYPDGRHRVMLLYTAGYRSLPALVPSRNAEAVTRLVGTTFPDERIIVTRPRRNLSSMGWCSS